MGLQITDLPRPVTGEYHLFLPTDQNYWQSRYSQLRNEVPKCPIEIPKNNSEDASYQFEGYHEITKEKFRFYIPRFFCGFKDFYEVATQTLVVLDSGPDCRIFRAPIHPLFDIYHYDIPTRKVRMISHFKEIPEYLFTLIDREENKFLQQEFYSIKYEYYDYIPKDLREAFMVVSPDILDLLYIHLARNEGWNLVCQHARIQYGRRMTKDEIQADALFRSTSRSRRPTISSRRQ